MRSNATVPNGYVLFETETIVVIATLHSENTKTGDMVQIWIMNRHESPVQSVRDGSDSNVCFDCPHRGDGFTGRTCYVNVAQGPNSVWRAYRAGAYPFLNVAAYADAFRGRKIRFGAYGDPVLIPLHIVAALASASIGWTGYTHQWRRAEYQAYRAYIMASCDSEQDAVDAVVAGWRYFRVREKGARKAAGEISCPASDEAGKRTQCIRCGLCNGARANDARKNITIEVHGSGAKNFVAVGAIAPAA